MRPDHRGARRTPLRVVIALLLAAAFTALTVAPAQAAAYRFWGFYQLVDGTWQFAQKGPDQITPADGTVEGWRFAVGDEASTRLPRAVATFDEICATTAAQEGSKRVGVVVDFGRAADSAEATTPPEPKAVCAVVTTASTSTDVLRAAGELRMDKGLVCAVAGYPASDCGGEVKEVSAGAKAADTPIQLALPSATPTATPSDTPSAPTSVTASGTPTGAAPASPSEVAASTTGSSTASTIGYVVAGLALLALIVFLVLRSRSAARRTDA